VHGVLGSQATHVIISVAVCVCVFVSKGVIIFTKVSDYEPSARFSWSSGEGCWDHVSCVCVCVCVCMCVRVCLNLMHY